MTWATKAGPPFSAVRMPRRSAWVANATQESASDSPLASEELLIPLISSAEPPSFRIAEVQLPPVRVEGCRMIAFMTARGRSGTPRRAGSRMARSAA